MIVKANIADAAHVAALAVILWPDHTLTELVGEFTNHLSDVDNAVFLYVDNGQDVGFARRRCGATMSKGLTAVLWGIWRGFS